MASRRVVGSDLYHSNGLHVQYQSEGKYLLDWNAPSAYGVSERRDKKHRHRDHKCQRGSVPFIDKV